MIRHPNDLQRFTAAERVIHWIVAVCFVLLALSGLAFFHPAFWPFMQLFGGGVWARILHPFIGLLIAIAFCLEFLNFQSLNRMTPSDWTWIKRIRDLVAGSGQNMPPQEKFNAGQKLLFWAMAACILLLFLSGLVLWRAYIHVPVTLVRLAAVIHAAAGALMIGLILGHIYAAIWTKGAIQAMLYGTVTRAWARHHHEDWYRQMTGGQP
jgi:formate dehydrogenase subunit gamma